MLLAFDISKRHTEVLAFTIMYNQVDFGTYWRIGALSSRRSLHRRSAGLGTGGPACGVPQADGATTSTGREGRACSMRLRPRWVEALAAQVVECRRVRLASGLSVS